MTVPKTFPVAVYLNPLALPVRFCLSRIRSLTFRAKHHSADAICLVVGETIRDVQYAQVVPDELNLLNVPQVEKRSRWFFLSGPFLLLKQRYRLSRRILSQIVKVSLLFFAQLVFANVRTLVRT